MNDFLLKVKTAYETAYDFNIVKNMKLYSKPAIYHGGDTFDLKKRWYVYYSYRHPETGYLVRQTPIYLDANKRFKTLNDRLKAFNILRNQVEKLLKEGYSPYAKTQIHEVYTAKSVLDYALSLKEKTVSKKSYEEYSGVVKHFSNFLSKNGLLNSDIKSVTKQHVISFLNNKLRDTSPSTRNAYRKVLNIIFEVLVSEDYIEKNFISEIPKLKSTPVKNKSYTQDQSDDLFEYLKEKEPELFMLIQFVSYNFLRPVEACRLQVKDLDLKSDIPTLFVRAKNQIQKTKIIPDIMLEELKKLDLSNPEAYLITKDGVAESTLSPDDRRHYFSAKFLKVKKKLELGTDYTVYSFRHTFITKLYRKIRENYGQFETYDKLMLITGHLSLDALKKYLRDIDAELPEDYSDLFK